jgi:hypothetical protein
MTRSIGMLLVFVVLTGCRGQWQWVEEVGVVREVSCPGGRVDVERRTTNVIGGQARNTVVRTNTCLN